jgi:hypothetical protein
VEERRPLPELAGEWGITLKEAVALCAVSGVKIPGPNATLTAAQAEHVEDVLAGRADMQVPVTSTPAGPVAVRAIVALVGVAVLVGLGVVIAQFGNRETVIAVLPDDCFDDPGMFGSDLKPVPCDGPHDFRVDAVLHLEPIFGQTYPGWERIEQHAEDRCAALGAGRETTRVLDTVVEFYYFGPRDEQAWESVRSRKVVCATRALS